MSEKSRIDDLEERIARLERTLFPLDHPAPYPAWPSIGIGKTKCAVCGLDWSGPMGYVCPNSACPIQPRSTC